MSLNDTGDIGGRAEAVRKQAVSPKLVGYAEGVVHGWEEAARQDQPRQLRR